MNRLKLYYTENKPPGILGKFFTEMAKFEVKEKRKLNFQLLLDYTSSLLIIYNGKTKKLSAKIAGYRNKKVKLNLPENSYIFLLKFKPEVFNLLVKGKVEDYKNKLSTFQDIKFSNSEITDDEILKIITYYFEQSIFDFTRVKNYITEAIELITYNNGVFRTEELVQKEKISIRQFQREFKKVTGFSPKEFSSIVRINSLTSELVKENVSLRDIFFDLGFYDQAHFNKEFKKIIGANPSMFESRQKLIRYLNLLK
ncbi:MAG: AraC family transcriptional regulator [Ignavibacteria bacterium]|nr:AraC family transcriptional regulator [Ignavibacteria bacterium]